jgi:hypothetical protein
MRMNRNKWAAFLILVLAISAAWSTAVFALGSTPTSDGTINSCYQNHSNDRETQGQLRVVSDPANCKSNETPLSWSNATASSVIFAGPAFPLANATIFSIGGAACISEELCRFAAPRSGEVGNLFVVPSTVPNAAASVDIKLRINGADTPLSVTHEGAVDGSNTKSNTSDIVIISQGDLISFSFTETGGSNSNAAYIASVEFK